MTRSSSRRKLAALLLGLSLAAPLAAASKPRAPAETGADVAAPSLWDLLDKLWEFLSPGVWSKCGASPDPDGRCTSQPAGGGSWSKCGAMPDPNGGCASQPASGSSPNVGGSADPNG